MLPSPQAASVVRDVNTVNYYSGVANVNIPIYSLPHHKDFEIPINLSYNTGGNKIQDLAGPVGLGWSLQAGGMITRVVRGIPDTETNFIDPQDSDDYWDIIDLSKDSERDAFYFSTPFGSAKFVLIDDNGYSSPYQDIVISKIGDV